MSLKKVSDVFNDRQFEVPSYQRGYAWEVDNVRDLFNDIKEAVEIDSDHYIGTIVLAKTANRKSVLQVVDGQQRLTTVTLLIKGLISRLDQDDRSYYHRQYIQDSEYKLLPLNQDKSFFEGILGDKKDLVPVSKSQKLLKNAYEEIERLLDTVENPRSFLRSLTSLQIMEFVQEKEGDAIRIFQTVNDRGKPLSIMEKAKSLLIYYSNRYLDGELDDILNEKFGKIFEHYEQIKSIGEEYKITSIASKPFNEDNILRYHFIAYFDEDRDPTSESVLSYIKGKLKDLAADKTTKSSESLKLFLDEYSSGLLSFFSSFRAVVSRVTTDKDYLSLFSILGLSTTLYPLIIKLNQLDILDKGVILEDGTSTSILHLIETVDFRVYKIRGTNPQAHVVGYTREVNIETSAKDVANWMLWFRSYWMWDDYLRDELHKDMYRNAALSHIYLSYSEKIRGSLFLHSDLIKTIGGKTNVEHVLAQDPKFKPKAFGFIDEVDYKTYESTLGNLSLVERGINSGLSNNNPIEKIDGYTKSMYDCTKQLASIISTQQSFKKEDIIKRTEEIIEFCIERYS